MNLSLLYEELRRRRVFRVVVAYGIASFAVLQIAEPAMHGLHLEEWVLTAVLVLLGLGFPVAVALAWAFDVGPGGIERTPPLPRPEAAAREVTTPAAPAPRAVPAVAVLPFADLSPEQDQAYFCDGIAEELLDALCCVSGMRVVPRSSSFQFKGRDVDSREIGRALGATTLLEGSVRKAGSRVRVAARLVDATEGLELWSQRFDRELTDVFAVQEEIARALVKAMEIRPSSTEEERLGKVGASRATRSAEAYEHYLRGRHHLMAHGDRQIGLARESFRRAVELDPSFAHAHAGLADADVMILQWNFDLEHPEQVRAEALGASGEAIRLRPDLAEAHLARANILTVMGQAEEGDREFRTAAELNPGWGDACYFHGRALAVAGRLDEAVAVYEEAARRNPDDFASLSLLVNVHERRGDTAAARDAARRAEEAVQRRLRIDPSDERALYMGAIGDLLYGDRARGIARAERVVASGRGDFATLYNLACFYVRLGDKDRALQLLDRAVGSGRGSRKWMQSDADLEALRSDPRFQAILARVRS